MYNEGDISGATLQGHLWITLDECAARCTANEECNSFEHNLDEHCNLNKEREPDSPKYGNFIFCSKNE